MEEILTEKSINVRRLVVFDPFAVVCGGWWVRHGQPLGVKGGVETLVFRRRQKPVWSQISVLHASQLIRPSFSGAIGQTSIQPRSNFI